MSQLEGWFQSWVPQSVLSAGGGRSSVEAWYTSALDIEEVLSGATDSHLHLFVADVVKSFDTVDREILDRVLSSLGLPGWFRHAFFEYHAHVRLRFKLASGLGEPWTRDGEIHQGCLCVLLSTSREVRRDMKDWVLSDGGDKWSVRFDVRDLEGHLDTTFRGWSSTLAARVRLVISRLVLIFALLLDFHGRVRVVRSMYLPAALHGIESSLLASDSSRKLRSSICKVVW